MQIRSFRGSGEPAWVIAPSSAGKRLGPDPRRALGPAATPAASTGRTRDRTRPMLQKRQKVLARAPSTRDPSRPLSRQAACFDLADELIGSFGQALARTLDVEHRGGSLAIHQLGDARAMSGAAQARLQLLGLRDEARRICGGPRENDWRLHFED